MEKFSIGLPLTGEYLTTVRLTTGGLCALVGFDMDSAEDYKVCVTESLLILKRNGFARARIEFVVGQQLSCELIGEDATCERGDELEDEISRALLGALLGEVEFDKNANGVVERIFFRG